MDDEQQRYQLALAAADLRFAQAERERLVNGARQQERSEAESLWRAKQAELEGAERAWRRGQRLLQRNAIAQQQVDDQRTVVTALEAEVQAAQAHREKLAADARNDEMSMADARIEAAQARLELAKVQLERTALRAPLRGQVLQVNVDVGELVGPTAGRHGGYQSLLRKSLRRGARCAPGRRQHGRLRHRRRGPRPATLRPRDAREPGHEPEEALE
jgi:HlyD family secretion protein